ncbi:unnamed protein product [Lota lota]
MEEEVEEELEEEVEETEEEVEEKEEEEEKEVKEEEQYAEGRGAKKPEPPESLNGERTEDEPGSDEEELSAPPTLPQQTR